MLKYGLVERFVVKLLLNLVIDRSRFAIVVDVTINYW